MQFSNYIFKGSNLYDQYKMIKKLNEQSKNNKSDFNFLILTGKTENPKDELHITAKRFSEECKKNKISYYILFTEDSRIEKNDDGTYIAYNEDDKKGFIISSDKTISINRGSVMSKYNPRNIISQLEKANIFCINYRDTIEICSDKYRTMLKIVQSNIPSPKTAIIQGIDRIEDIIEQIGGKFPFILKTLSGSKGIGVIFIESLTALKSTLQLIWKINPDEEMLIQEYLKTDFDIRAHVLGGEVIASMKRYVIENDFRSNYSQGGEVEKYEMSDKEKEICIKAAKAVGASWAGVDYILKNKTPFVLEVNSSPGTDGIEKATGENIVKMVIDWCVNKKNWNKKSLEVGYKEKVIINDIEYEAKFDTGNGLFCVIHSDEYNIDEKKNIVSWKSNGKKYINNLEEIFEVEIGGITTSKEKRPKILLDVFFNGSLYKDIEFTLTQREDKSPVLISRRFMKKANISINPSQKYIITVEK